MLYATKNNNMIRIGELKMKRKIIGILVCTLLLSMTFSAATAQEISIDNDKDENQGINVLNNSPPTDPDINCPDKVRENRIFIARVVSTDPDDDPIYYRVKIEETGKPGDWIGPYNSGVEYVNGIGIFKFTGEIIIGFQAKDKWGLESDWSYHTITFVEVKTRSIMSPLINILQNHPLMFPLLRQILGL